MDPPFAEDSRTEPNQDSGPEVSSVPGTEAGGTPRADLPLCDLIMKGGITSGVIYPRAVGRISKRYRLKKIGGASAGAIAAVFAAAAEYGERTVAAGEVDESSLRRTSSSAVGFRRLELVPDELGERLRTLFQPMPGTATVYRAITAWLEPEPVRTSRGDTAAKPMRALSKSQRGRAIAKRLATTWGMVVRAHPCTFGAALLAGLAPLVPALSSVKWSRGGPVSSAAPLALAWMATSAAAATGVAGSALVGRALKAMAGNGFALCDGHTRHPSGGGDEPLTDWMTRTIDEIAGVSHHLTFGDLWGEEATARREAQLSGAGDDTATVQDWRDNDPEVDLLVMTTNLTFRRPYTFPFTQHDRFYFCEVCWRQYFPSSVIGQLTTAIEGGPAPDKLPASASGEGEASIPMRCPRHPDDAEAVWLLPDAAKIPIVVAARLSLSFPLLISAVPMLCIDYARADDRRSLICTWFSDGGIASNFPMHFFDAPWPRRPTFGIDLQSLHPDYPDQRVWRHTESKPRPFPRSQAITGVVDFLSAMVRTMQNWADETQITLPGFRDRVVEVRLGEDEGGINLQMAPSTIESLAELGDKGAEAFESFDFEQHSWVRYRAAMSALTELIDKMAENYQPEKGEGYQGFLSRYSSSAAVYAHASRDAIEADITATADLMQVAKQWAERQYPLNAPQVPAPRPHFRPAPPL